MRTPARELALLRLARRGEECGKPAGFMCITPSRRRRV